MVIYDHFKLCKEERTEMLTLEGKIVHPADNCV